MGCVKYNSLVYDVDCTITQINSIYGNQYSICPGKLNCMVIDSIYREINIAYVQVSESIVRPDFFLLSGSREISDQSMGRRRK